MNFADAIRPESGLTKPRVSRQRCRRRLCERVSAPGVAELALFLAKTAKNLHFAETLVLECDI